MELVAPADSFPDHSIAYRANRTSQALILACASYEPRQALLVELLQLGDDREQTLTTRRENIAELGFADSGDSARKKEKEWLFDLSVELMILVETDLPGPPLKAVG